MISLNAQVGIGTNTPASSLDIIASDVLAPANTDGILIPRMDEFPLIDPTIAQDGMLVFISGNGAAIRGFYFWNNGATSWDEIGGVSGWLKTGNTDIVNGTNYIGTGASTNVDVAFRRNNAAAGKIGSSSTSIGVGALNNGASTNSTAYGNNALSVSTGNNNVAIGQNALQNSATTAQWNTAVGTGALRGINNAAAQSNTAVGYEAMTGAGNISNCVAIGYHALFQNRANNSTAIGHNALQGNTTQVGNTAIGYTALNNAGGTNNTALGFEAGFNATGSNNTCLGYQSGRFATGGSNNTFVGFQTGNATTGTNNTAIGFGAQVPTTSGNNQIRIGNTSVGYAGVQVAWTITSDKRLKTNTENSLLGLDFIKTVRPVSYFRKNDSSQKTEYGFIAQEVEDALKRHGDYNNGIVSKDDAGMYAVRYNDFIPITIKAIQEQQLLIELLQKTNAELKETNAIILERLEALENK